MSVSVAINGGVHLHHRSKKALSGPLAAASIPPISLEGSFLPCLAHGSAKRPFDSCPRSGERHPPRWGISLLPLGRAGDGEMLERLAARGHAELAEEALHVRADRVLRDEEALGDLVGAEMVVEEQQDLDLPR